MKTTLSRKALAGSAALLTTFALLGTGVAANAADANPLFLSFEAADTVGAPAATQAFEGGSAAISASDHLTGQSFKFTKSGQPWSGVNLLLTPITPAIKYADATKHTITFDYWSNDTEASPVMVALETATPSWQGGPKTMKTVQASPGLNHLTFDMATGTGWDATKEWVTMAVFPNFGADDTTYTGAAAIASTGQVYEIDNVSINGGTIANVNGAVPAVVVKPAVRVAATVAGTAKVGKSLTAGKGTWTGTGITYSYKWYRCTVQAKTTGTAAPAASAKCSVISGASAASYKVVTADVGKYLRVLVTARNSAGSTLSLSKSTTAKATK